MESSIAVFLKRWTASELPPTVYPSGSTKACSKAKRQSSHAACGFPVSVTGIWRWPQVHWCIIALTHESFNLNALSTSVELAL